MRLHTANRHKAKADLWRWWRPRFDQGDFNAFLMSLQWKGRDSRYFRTPKDSMFWALTLPLKEPRP